MDFLWTLQIRPKEKIAYQIVKPKIQIVQYFYIKILTTIINN